MLKRGWTAVFFLALQTFCSHSAQAFWGGDKDLADLYFGEALFYAFQENYFAAITRLDVERYPLAVVIEPAGADGDDVAQLRLLLSGVRDDQAAGADFVLPALPDDDAVSERYDFDTRLLLCLGSHDGSPPSDR